MSVDFEPTINPLPTTESSINIQRTTYNQTGSFRFWCQKVLPLVYDDSLSYYELLCKVVNFLNEVISNVDSLHDENTNVISAFNSLQTYVNTTDAAMTDYVNDSVESILNAYEELQGYVNDYFDNLDVQEEINNKLDAMADSGELSALIQPLLVTYQTQLDLLEDRIDNLEGSYSTGGTTADAELIDIRVSANGGTFDNAGNSVRGQINAVANRSNALDFAVKYYGQHVKLATNESRAVERVGVERTESNIIFTGRTTTNTYMNIMDNMSRSVLSDVDNTKTFSGFVDGHTYILNLRKISGSYENASPTGISMQIRTANSSRTLIDQVVFVSAEINGGYKEYTHSGSDPVLLLFFMGSNYTFTNFELQLNIIDLTAMRAFGFNKIVDDEVTALHTEDTRLENTKANYLNSKYINMSAVPGYKLPKLMQHIEPEFFSDYDVISNTRKPFIQGICSDGERYLYYCLTSERGETVTIHKYDTWLKKVVLKSDGRDYGHGEDLCFIPGWMPGLDNGDVDRIYIMDINFSSSHSTGGYIHVVNAATLEFITSFSGSALVNNTYWSVPSRICCDIHRGLICVLTEALVNDTMYWTLAVFNNDTLVKMVTAERAAGQGFGIDCDENYIYVTRYRTKNAEQNTFYIYGYCVDWNLNPVSQFEFTQANWEIEGVCHIGTDIYCSYNETARDNRKAYVYKYTPIYKWLPVDQVFPVDWPTSDGYDRTTWTVLYPTT